MLELNIIAGSLGLAGWLASSTKYSDYFYGAAAACFLLSIFVGKL